MHARPYERDTCSESANFSAFIGGAFAYTPRWYKYPSRSPGVRGVARRDKLPNPIELWNRKLQSYADFEANGTVASVWLNTQRLYDLEAMRAALQPLVADGYMRCANRSIEYPFTPGSGKANDNKWANASGKANGNKWANTFSREGFDEAKKYDAQQEWRALLTQDDLDFINARVDHKLMAKYDLPIVARLHEGSSASSSGGAARRTTTSRLSQPERREEDLARHMRVLQYLQ